MIRYQPQISVNFERQGGECFSPFLHTSHELFVALTMCHHFFFPLSFFLPSDSLSEEELLSLSLPLLLLLPLELELLEEDEDDDEELSLSESDDDESDEELDEDEISASRRLLFFFSFPAPLVASAVVSSSAAPGGRSRLNLGLRAGFASCVSLDTT